MQLAQVRVESDDGATAAASNISTSSTSSGPPIAAAATLATASATSSTPAAPTTTTTTQAAVRPRRPQQSLMGTYVTRPMDPLRQTKLDEALIKMIACDYQSFSIVEEKGFKDLSKTLDPSYTLPSRKTLSQALLPKMHGKLTAELLKKSIVLLLYVSQQTVGHL